MIKIENKENCCGCSACFNACPQRCITMQADCEGFLYPVTDVSICTECGLCEKVCPIINRKENHSLQVLAAKNPNNHIRKDSTSGGLFSAIAEKIIEDGGRVFGATFNDNWEVVHKGVDNIQHLSCLRGSKYVQSNIADCFKEIKQLLEQNIPVLFSGTPCQAAGLKLYLKKEYSNLFITDIVCHGVPSPQIWKEYLHSVKENVQDIRYINFRKKERGWADADFIITNQKGNSIVKDKFRENLYFKGFMDNLYLRPSCYKCPARYGFYQSDITLGDYWGIEKQHPEFADADGVSLVIVNSEKGKKLLEELNIQIQESSIEKATDNRNACILNNPKRTIDSAYFWKQYKKIGVAAIAKSLEHKKKPSLRRFCNKMLDRLKQR